MDYQGLKGITLNTKNIEFMDLPVFHYKATYSQTAKRVTPSLGSYDNIKPSLLYTRQSSLSKFFSSHLISVPRSLKATRSVRIKELPWWHLTGMLMRSGKREFMLAHLWSFILNPTANANGTILGNDSSTTILNALRTYEPIFAYKVQRVAKSARKNSRGKSGKYLVLWKYVPVYNRLKIVMRWLVTDIRLGKGRTFKLRFIQVVRSLLFNIAETSIPKLYKFNHFFIFKHFRKTLLASLKTTRSPSE